MALIVGVNSYASRADADAYFADSLRGATWSALIDQTKDQALVEATRVFERQAWAGQKEVPTQDLQFPRIGLTDCQGNSVTAADSLELISEAQFEYALFLQQNPNGLNTSDATGTNIRRQRAGSAEIEFFKSTAGTRFPVIIQDIVGCFLAGSQVLATIGAAFASGTNEESSFNDRDKYGVTEGL